MKGQHTPFNEREFLADPARTASSYWPEIPELFDFGFALFHLLNQLTSGSKPLS